MTLKPSRQVVFPYILPYQIGGYHIRSAFSTKVVCHRMEEYCGGQYEKKYQHA